MEANLSQSGAAVIARILVLSLAISGLIASAQSVAVTLNFTGGGIPGNGVAVITGTGSIAPFGSASVTIVVDASANSHVGSPALVSIQIGNIGKGGSFIDSTLPSLSAHTRTPAVIQSA